MINIGFWNLARKINTSLVEDFIFHHSLNILALAEHDNSNLASVLTNINHITKNNYKQITLQSRLALIVDDSVTTATLKHEADYFSILELKIQNNFKVLLALVHLPSKLYAKQEDYTLATQELVDSITEQEKNLQNNKCILLGDFNLDPYESTVVGAHTLHAISDKKIAIKIGRKVQSKYYDFFYNPMWAHFADGQGNAGGTYFYYNTSAHAPFWHIFDQVLIRPSLINNFNDSRLEIVKKINSVELINNSGRPIKKISDHLPIKFSINY